MAKILAPNQEYTGVSASVAFLNGAGETDNPHLIQWFIENGYEVELSDADEEHFPDDSLPVLKEIKGEDLVAFYQEHMGADPGEKTPKEMRVELRTAGHGK